MEELIHSITVWIQNFVLNNNILISLFIGSFIVILESILPFLPLAVFIAINIIAFGSVLGFILSYISTIIGCTISFYLVRCLKKYNNSEVIHKLIIKFESLKFSNLVIITAVPFTPAFSINIAAGLSKMKYKKFLSVLIIAKLSTIYFWGFIGTTLIESITDIVVISKILVLLLTTFILSKMIMRHFDIY